MVRSDHGGSADERATWLAMPMSRLYLGLPREAEIALRTESPCDLDELHWCAQRVCQLARYAAADVGALRKLVPRIEKRVGQHFMGQLTLALAERILGQHERADLAWQRARDQMPTQHVWSPVVPDAALWRRHSPESEPRLVEEEPGRVYRLVGETKPEGAAFGTLGVGRLLRVASGVLVFINPVPIPESLVPQIYALGDVRHVVAPSKYHSVHVMGAKHRFPRAKAWGVPAHRGYARVADVGFDGYLDDTAPLFPGELDQITLHGNDVGDVWLLDRASSTLITTDALFFATDASDEYATAFSRFYAWAWGVCGRNGVPSYQPPMWRDLPRYRAALQRAFALPFEHVAYCHGAWRAIDGQGHSQLREALGWIVELSSFEAMKLSFDFVRRHPGVVYRALRDGGA